MSVSIKMFNFSGPLSSRELQSVLLAMLRHGQPPNIFLSEFWLTIIWRTINWMWSRRRHHRSAVISGPTHGCSHSHSCPHHLSWALQIAHHRRHHCRRLWTKEILQKLVLLSVELPLPFKTMFIKIGQFEDTFGVWKWVKKSVIWSYFSMSFFGIIKAVLEFRHPATPLNC